MQSMEKVDKNDFIEMEYTGKANGEVFDSNIPEELKKLNPKAKAEKLKIVVGQGLVVPGLDKALEGKEVGKEYDVLIPAKEGFGARRRELVKTIPQKIFTEKQMVPKPGMVFALDNNLVKILAVSGARVIVDFNNPLSGKDLEYKFKIIKKIVEEKEKAEVLFEIFFRKVPEFEIKEKVIVKGVKELEMFVKVFGDRFKELLGKELVFEEKKEISVEKSEEKTEVQKVEENEKK